MSTNSNDQSMLITEEYGAGKTENIENAKWSHTWLMTSMSAFVYLIAKSPWWQWRVGTHWCFPWLHWLYSWSEMGGIATRSLLLPGLVVRLSSSKIVGMIEPNLTTWDSSTRMLISFGCNLLELFQAFYRHKIKVATDWFTKDLTCAQTTIGVGGIVRTCFWLPLPMAYPQG